MLILYRAQLILFHTNSRLLDPNFHSMDRDFFVTMDATTARDRMARHG